MLKIVDATEALPIHSERKWEQRNSSNIRGCVIHQSASTGEMFNVAKYHVSATSDRDGDGIIKSWERNHISPRGCPGICYTFGITSDGTIYLMNDIENIVWHAKGKNTNYLGVVIFCDSTGPSYKGIKEPSLSQTDSLIELMNYIKDYLLSENVLQKSDFFGHCEVDSINKLNCPGNITMEVLQDWRNS